MPRPPGKSTPDNRKAQGQRPEARRVCKEDELWKGRGATRIELDSLPFAVVLSVVLKALLDDHLYGLSQLRNVHSGILRFAIFSIAPMTCRHTFHFPRCILRLST